MSFSTDIKEWAPLVHIARTAATRLLPKVTKAVTKAGPSTAATAPSMAIDKGKQVKDMINNGTKNQLLKLVQIVMGGRRAV